MADLYILLLTLFSATLGWIIANWVINRNNKNTQSDFRLNYFKGLNYVLNEQPDKAIEVFCKMLEQDKETIEVQMAVGNLFRRRGEVDKAIQIHQSLVNRPKLNEKHSIQGTFELAEDFMKAGLLDRAEKLYQQLRNNQYYGSIVHKRLLTIFQQEKDWRRAYEIASQMEQNEEAKSIMAHYHCEMAEALLNSNISAALGHVKQALETDKNCVRASLLLGHIHSEENNFNKAIDAYKKVEKQNINYLPEIVQPLKTCYEKIGKQEELLDYLKSLLKKKNDISIVLIITGLIKSQKNNQEAIQFMVAQLSKSSSIRGLDQLITLYISDTTTMSGKELDIIKDIVARLVQDNANYLCQQCGFSSRKLYWQCPSCKTWDTLKPMLRKQAS